MIRDIKRTASFILGMVVILTLSPQTSGGGSWRRLEKLFVQDQPSGENWDRNRIIFPDEAEDPTRSSWRPSTTPRYEDPRRLCQDTCKISREYSPVCGTNGVTYQNMDQLQCDMRCGVAVDLQRSSPCSSNGPPIRSTRTPPFTTTTYRPPFSTTQRNEALEQCIRSCPSTPEYNPVCGTNYVTYPNIGKMECAKFCGVDVSMWRHAPCPAYVTSTTVAPTTINPDVAVQECIRSCPSTPEYNPVCGTNNVTYNNIGKLECAMYCGVQVRARKYGRCTTVRNSQPFDKDSSEEDYGDDNIDSRFSPRDRTKDFWK